MAQFLTTQWSLVQLAGREEPAGAAALEDLCRAYWQPMHTYAMRRGLTRQDAEDTTQAFFAKLIEKDWLLTVDQARGKFRTFLLTAMQRHMSTEYRAETAQKRGGGWAAESLDTPSSSSLQDNALTPEAAFDKRWAETVMQRALQKLRADAEAAGKKTWFAQMQPWLANDSRSLDSNAQAKALGISTTALRQAILRLRQHYREAVHAEIAATVSAPEMVDEELKALISALRS
jgi:RNA polymerase sigma factor (sigma-70 family)